MKKVIVLKQKTANAKKAKVVPAWKKSKVDEIKKLTTSYSTIALIDLTSLPTKQLQIVRKKLGEKVKFVIAKKILIQKAFESSANPKGKDLLPYLGKEPALLVTNLNAFELFGQFKKNRQNTPAKTGQLAPNDIWVQAGPTPFTPGPVISELAQLKIKAGVVSGKIEIKAPALVVEQGKPVPQLAASILARLGIEPMQIGVTLVAALEGTDLYFAKVLDIDLDKTKTDIQTAHMDAFKLAVELEIMSKEVVEYLIAKAEREAKALEPLISNQAH